MEPIKESKFIRIKEYEGIEKAVYDVSIHDPCWVCGETATQGVIFEEIDDGCLDVQICDKCIIKIIDKLKELKP